MTNNALSPKVLLLDNSFDNLHFGFLSTPRSILRRALVSVLNGRSVFCLCLPNLIAQQASGAQVMCIEKTVVCMEDIDVVHLHAALHQLISPYLKPASSLFF